LKLDFGNQGKVIGYFRREFIKTAVFPKEMSYIIDTLFDTRNKSDYDDFFIISKEEVTEQHTSAEAFITEIQKYLKQQEVSIQ